jgi:hypothetical protein
VTRGWLRAASALRYSALASRWTRLWPAAHLTVRRRMSSPAHLRSALRVFASVLVAIVALGALLELWAPHGEGFVDLVWSGDESAPPFHSWFIWPTSFMLFATHGIVNTLWYEVVAISVGINVAIYAAVGFAVSSALKVIRVAV